MFTILFIYFKKIIECSEKPWNILNNDKIITENLKNQNCTTCIMSNPVHMLIISMQSIWSFRNFFYTLNFCIFCPFSIYTYFNFHIRVDKCIISGVCVCLCSLSHISWHNKHFTRFHVFMLFEIYFFCTFYPFYSEKHNFCLNFINSLWFVVILLLFLYKISRKKV